MSGGYIQIAEAEDNLMCHGRCTMVWSTSISGRGPATTWPSMSEAVTNKPTLACDLLISCAEQRLQLCWCQRHLACVCRRFKPPSRLPRLALTWCISWINTSQRRPSRIVIFWSVPTTLNMVSVCPSLSLHASFSAAIAYPSHASLRQSYMKHWSQRLLSGLETCVF